MISIDELPFELERLLLARRRQRSRMLTAVALLAATELGAFALFACLGTLQ